MTTVSINLVEHRSEAIAEAGFRPDSLVGSYFHGSADVQYQGLVVAEPAAGVYLVELDNWIDGQSDIQRLVRLEDMMAWSFYDTREWALGCLASRRAEWAASPTECG